MKVRVCPKCGRVVKRKGGLSYAGVIFGVDEFQCMCGYYGSFFPEIDKKNLKEFSKRIKK